MSPPLPELIGTMSYQRKVITLFVAIVLMVALYGPHVVRSVSLSDAQQQEAARVFAMDDAPAPKRKSGGFGRALGAPFRALAKLFGGGKKARKEEAKKTKTEPPVVATATEPPTSVVLTRKAEDQEERKGNKDRKRASSERAEAMSPPPAPTSVPAPPAPVDTTKIVRPLETRPAPPAGLWIPVIEGIPKDPLKALEIVFKGKGEPTDAFLVNDSFACMLCGLGFDAQVAHDFAKDPKRGLMTYVKKTVSNFFTAKTYSFVLDVNGREIRTDAFFISIANSNQFGNHFTIAPRASLKDGLLDIVVMTRQNKLSVLLGAFLQVGGYNRLQEIDVLNENASVIYFQAPAINILNPGGAPMHIDGDPVETAKTIRIKLLHHCFRLLCP